MSFYYTIKGSVDVGFTLLVYKYLDDDILTVFWSVPRKYNTLQEVLDEINLLEDGEEE